MQIKFLESKIKTNRLYNSIVLFIRNRKSKRGVLLLSKKTSHKNNKTFFLFIALIITFAVIIIFHLNTYLQIKVTPYLQSEKIELAPKVLNDSKEINVLFLGFDDTQNQHRFLNMIAIISVDYLTGSIKIYNLNPNYLVRLNNNNNVTIRTAFNLNTSSEETKMLELMTLLENVSGTRLDRYMAFNYSDLKSLIELTDLKLEASKSYKIDDIFISQGEILSGDLLNKFITSEVFPDDDLIRRQGLFLKELLETLRDSFTLYRFFLNGSQFTEILKTNFTKEEFVRFIANISTTGSFIGNGYASKSLTLADQSQLKLEEGIPYSDMLLDEDISRIFRNISIIKEQGKVEVYNATDRSGLAYQIKRKLENTGITVIKTGNYPDNQNKNTLYIPKNNSDNFINTIRIIRSILRDEVDIVIGEYKFNYSGDMILVIGNI